MSDQPLLLYGMGSPNVRKVVILLEELELPYDLRHVAVFKGEQFTSEFLALNPLGKVPVLVDPQLGRPLAESGAILIHLAEREGRLLPAEPAPRSEVLQWLMVQMASIGPMFGQLNHFQILPEASQDYALGRYREQSGRLYRLLNERLTTHAWIAGGAYSIADIAIYPWALYLARHGFDSARYPALIRWCETIGARPAAQRADARMDQAFTSVSTQTRQSATPRDLDLFFGRTANMPVADYSAVTR